MTQVFGVLDEIGKGILFLGALFRISIRQPITFKMVAEQILSITQKSVSTTALAGFFAGAIMSIQFTLQLTPFGALVYLGGLSTSATIREVGPLLIAFMLSGKVGAYTAAELGTMKVTEQIDAIRCLGANPLREIILPRFFGIIISSFFLLAAGLIMSIGGGLLIGMIFSHISPASYIRHIPNIVNFTSIISGLIKCFVFAFVLASICTYRGYATEGGAQGVGRAVLQTAVSTMVGIVVADWFTSFIGDAVLKMLGVY
jgi:phospholipid/cholesterol/gamma-HCH transport system permease protein